MRVTDDALDSPVAKFLSDGELAGIRTQLEAEPGDLLLLVADQRPVVRHVLGLLRLELGRPPVTEGGLHFLWVVDFPLFEGLGDDGSPVPAHHPFTMPHPDDLDLLDSDDPADLLRVRSQAYDLVLNGWELGSGSVRIHRRRAADHLRAARHRPRCGAGALRLPARRLPLRRAAHAGFASASTGWWPCWWGRRTSARWWPSQDPVGRDPLTNAPTPVEPAYLAELGLRTLPPRADRAVARGRAPAAPHQGPGHLDDLDHDVHPRTRRSTGRGGRPGGRGPAAHRVPPGRCPPARGHPGRARVG